MTVLVTGGVGFIGSHTCVELLGGGHTVIVADNLCNSERGVIDRIAAIAGVGVQFYEIDVTDESAVERIFAAHKIDCVIHFAALKAVAESVEKPLEYYANNLGGLLTLCRVMRRHDCRNFIFSSSATVYGKPASLPIREDFPLSVTNPYGSTKLMSETILKDLAASDPAWKVVLLRYFNPVGAHDSHLLGEKPSGIPNNLMPRIVRVAKGEAPYMTVYGNDYNTPDGTGVRDYIHVVDLARGHLYAMKKFEQPETGVFIYNLGTGAGYSVLQLIDTFSRVNGVEIPYRIEPRRPGDVDACYADPSKAAAELGWRAERTLEDMCRSSWEFAKKSL